MPHSPPEVPCSPPNASSAVETKNAFVPAGGMHHHAMSDRASGFGIFNDAVIAIKHIIDQGLRVFYVDIDVHHGDGVQAGFTIPTAR